MVLFLQRSRLLYLLLAKRFRLAGAVLIGLMIPLSAIEIWRIVYYGFPLPNTYYAKVDGTFTNRILSAGLILLSLPKTGILPYLIITLTPPLFWVKDLIIKRRKPVLLFINFFGSAFFLYWVWVGGDIFLERFLLMCYPIAILTIFARLDGEFQASQSWLKRAGVNILIGLVLVFNAAPLLFDGRFTYTQKNYDMFRELGLFLGQNYPGKLIAVDAAGKIPFYSQLRAIDMLGLNDAKIAHGGFQSLVVGHNKYDPDYVFSREPDLIISWISAPSFDLERGMPQERYSAHGYCLKYLIYSGLG